MTQEDLNVLAGFAQVWERVSGQRIDEKPAPSVGWEAVLKGLYEHWQGCAALSLRAAGMHRRRLTELAAEAKGAFRMVQTEYYLETGDIYTGGTACNFASYTPYNLRKLCKNAVKLAELLQKATEEECLPVKDARERISGHEKILKELLSGILQ